MAMGIRCTGGRDDYHLAAFLKDIEQSTDEAATKVLREAGKQLKASIKRHMPKSIKLKAGRTVHMVDDVIYSVTADKKYGGKVLRVRGGKKTGTLWHIVNDGTYRSRATHFMDKAIVEVDNQMDGLLDEAIVQKAMGKILKTLSDRWF
jgi:HK97 gp10 family phage protein